MKEDTDPFLQELVAYGHGAEPRADDDPLADRLVAQVLRERTRRKRVATITAMAAAVLLAVWGQDAGLAGDPQHGRVALAPAATAPGQASAVAGAAVSRHDEGSPRETHRRDPGEARAAALKNREGRTLTHGEVDASYGDAQSDVPLTVHVGEASVHSVYSVYRIIAAGWGQHRIEVTQGSIEIVVGEDRPVTLHEGEHHLLSTAKDSPAAASKVAASRRRKPHARTPSRAHSEATGVEDFFARAFEHRRHSRFLDAATEYRALLRKHPNDAKAQTAAVSLAQLYLTELGRPEQAERWFAYYLATGGPLSEEAKQGRAEARLRMQSATPGPRNQDTSPSGR